MATISRTIPGLAIALLLASHADAGTLTVQIENDRIARTDRHYTHGTRIDYVSDRKTDGPDWAKAAVAKLYPFADLRAGLLGFSIGQNIYTPENKVTRDLVRNDRPYAGWLYAGLSVHVEAKDVFLTAAADRLDTVELQLGIVGPQAFGEQAQNEVHKLIDVAEANGWDNQLKNEPGVMLIAERKWKLQPAQLAGFEADVIPRLGGSIGNVMTFANAGATVRFGQSLDIDYGPPHVRPTLSGLAAVSAGPRAAWYLFGGVEGRAVLRNIFLDGNSFADSHSVDKKRFVADFQMGTAVVLYGVRVAFTHVFRTREFEGQPRADRYGALSISARF